MSFLKTVLVVILLKYIIILKGLILEMLLFRIDSSILLINIKVSILFVHSDIIPSNWPWRTELLVASTPSTPCHPAEPSDSGDRQQALAVALPHLN